MAADSSLFNHITSNKNSLKRAELRIVSAPAISAQRNVACVVDMDNVCSRRGKYGDWAWAHLDVLKFGAALKERGVTLGTICQHRPFASCGAKLWTSLGLKPVHTWKNADDQVKLEAVTYALEKNIGWLVLVACDGGYFDTLSTIRECGIKIELWALRNAVSRKLIFLADRVRWIDDLISEPHPPGNEAVNANIPPILGAIAA